MTESMIRPMHTTVATVALLIAAALARADTITYTGSSIPLRNCTIQQISGGQIAYLDQSGGRVVRPIEQIAALGWDDLPELDRAEALVAEQKTREAVRPMLRALLAATNDTQRLWIRSRLSQLHDLLGEYVPACAHAAVVFEYANEPNWVMLEPFSKPAPCTYPQAKEAMDAIASAQRKVTNPRLLATLTEMAQNIRPLLQSAEQAYDGPPLPAEGLYSGLTREQIMREEDDAAAPSGDALADPADDNADASDPMDTGATDEPDRDRTQPVEPTRPAPMPTGPQSPEALDALISQARFSEALQLCLRIAEAPGDRNLGRFLHQYGQVLVGVGRSRDAAVMFMRAAILYESSPWGVRGLIDAARVYDQAFDRPSTARRLLTLALERAESRRLDADAALARELLDSMKD